MGLRREPALDGLRAVAVIAVMGFHFAKPLMSGGSLGVDVFFVLSGFLITSILAAEITTTATLRFPRFLLRRAYRLLPALAVLLGAYWFLCPALWPQLADRRTIDVNTAVFYVTNLRETFAPASTPLSHTWSLAIEEQFYLLWPPALLFLLRFRRTNVATGLLVTWGLLTAGRWVCMHAWPGPAAYYFTPFHASGLLLGSALALHPLRVKSGRIALAALVALFVLGRTHATFIYTIPVAEILTAFIIVDPPRVLASAAAQFMGRISYGTYLWHIPLAWALGWPTSLVDAILLTALSLLAGALSYWTVEGPYRAFSTRDEAKRGTVLQMRLRPAKL